MKSCASQNKARSKLVVFDTFWAPTFQVCDPRAPPKSHPGEVLTSFRGHFWPLGKCGAPATSAHKACQNASAWLPQVPIATGGD